MYFGMIMGPSYPPENRLFQVTAHDHLRSALRSTTIACDYRGKLILKWS